MPDVIWNDNQAMFEFMWGASLGHGINVHEVLIEDISISGVD